MNIPELWFVKSKETWRQLLRTHTVRTIAFSLVAGWVSIWLAWQGLGWVGAWTLQTYLLGYWLRPDPTKDSQWSTDKGVFVLMTIGFLSGLITTLATVIGLAIGKIK